MYHMHISLGPKYVYYWFLPAKEKRGNLIKWHTVSAVIGVKKVFFPPVIFVFFSWSPL